ncbi:polysaccharide biosynthesis protein [Geobacter pickeringii]|uniref:Nucleoside-diphosphate sugar epimerase n=1 Tax=Geobacter pickeringii TaxID=345632 RepID=A0A0B5BG67_9BACT|nr:nucleoside-diphosphate sugar epimerase/dehydratase [Geobacter pickeringii]AJE03046.1 nucleoside-diphosphate sugar epimerase [Geobacter pickeringii]
MRQRRFLVFIVDVVLMAAAFYLSFLLRFDFILPSAEQELFLHGIFVVLAIKPLIFISSGMYRNIWRYASLQDGISIGKVVTLSTFITTFVLVLTRDTRPMPRSIYLLDWFLLFSFVSAARLLWRIYRETYIMPRQRSGKRTLIVGAGDAGNLLLKEIRKTVDSPYNVVGFVDDDKEKRDMRLSGIPVLGDLSRIKGIIRKHHVEEVIIAIPSASSEVIRKVVACCRECRVRFKTLPSIHAIIDGTVSIAQIKEVEIEDLLGREPVVLELEGIRGYLTDKRVLVTGAGGSIGSEICRQVAAFSPHKLLLFEAAETPLYHIEKELVAQYPDIRIIPVIGDVRDQGRVEAIFDEFLPEVVFHAAAYKHVPMMEYNPGEAVTNNIGGTRTLADAAHRSGVKNFVMISTDKAVNPTNIMGASKRAAEIYVQSLAKQSRTNFTTVRFGNVLGSNGSVIPLFKEQIKQGGPVTVTDPQVIRYFMTIPEACQLVLQAGCIGVGGEIFVLDMGAPMRIVDLAEELIRLSGFTPHEDIQIVFTGLRPGEKLFEELLIEGEGVKQTRHKKIRVLQSMEHDLGAVTAKLDALVSRAKNNDVANIVRSLQLIVPEFSPQYSFNGPPPSAFQRVRPDLFPPPSSKVVKLQKQ